MTASFTIAARNNGFSSADTRDVTMASVTAYREAMASFARSGDPVAITACLGGSDAFDKSITDFSHRYADQNEQDYQEFVKAIHSGRLEAREGV
jgi:uncharacterized protein (DUF2252 family)